MTTLPVSPFLSSANIVERSAEAPVVASTRPQPDGATAECFIGEIFVGAARLDDHRFVLDEQAFMDSIEALPLFLQDHEYERAGYRR